MGKEVSYNVRKMAAIMENKSPKELEDTRPEYEQDFSNMYELLKEGGAGEELDNPRQLAFLAAYSILGNVTHSAKCVGITARAVQYWHEDDDFMKYYQLAEKAHTHYLESEAQRRAVQGVKEPVFYQGEVIGHKVKYSDNLLMFLLKGKEPEQYRDNAKVEVTGDGGGPIKVEFSIPELQQGLENPEIVEGEEV